MLYKQKRPKFPLHMVRVFLLTGFLQKTGAQQGYLKCSIRGTNNQIRNRFYKSVRLQLFNVKCKFIYLQLLNVKYKFIQLNCLTSNIFFPKNIFLASRRERIFMDARPQFRVFNSAAKMMTCYLPDTNKYLRSRTLCTNILKCKFPTKIFSYANTKLLCNLEKETRASGFC